MMDKMDEKGKKPGLAVLIALKAKKGMGGMGEPEDMHGDVAREMLDAIKADDAKKFGKLLHEYVMMCMDEGGDDEKEEEDKDEY